VKLAPNVQRMVSLGVGVEWRQTASSLSLGRLVPHPS
jgi:hypothetical protein